MYEPWHIWNIRLQSCLGIFWMLPATFRHSWSYSCILRHIQNTWLIQAYLELEIYLVSFRHTIQVLLRSNLFIFWILFTQTQAYVELWFIYRHVMFHVYSDIFSTVEYVNKQYFMQNKEFSNLEPKMSYLLNFGLYVWKMFAIFEISTYELVKIQVPLKDKNL